ncbi:MAG: AMP-binding protein [Chloroflexota bacterium]|nr:AMP-binding protein [Dehalococcoidia bacterium]MDW8253824.1 AMP-binding protein [Chloroflexota bacterium]
MPALQMLIHDPLRWRAAAQPHHPAVRTAERTVSYRDLDRRSTRLANALIGAGVRPGDRVALLDQNSVEFLEATYAISKAGAVSVPLGYRLTERELATIVDHAGVSFAIVAPEYRDLLAAAAVGTALSPDRLLVLGEGGSYEAAIAAASEASPEIRVSDDAPYAFLYTSGTTGAPKGVVQAHRGRAVHQCLAAAEFDIRRDDCVLAAAPLYNSGPIFWALTTLSAGATVGLVRRFDAERLDADLQTLGVTYVPLMPTLFNRWIDAGEAAGSWSQPLPRVRMLLTAGEPLLAPTRERLFARFPAAGLVEHYGSTELGVVLLMRPEDHRRKPGSVGRPFFGQEVSLRDDHRREVATGEVGELWARGTAQMVGYYRQPEATSEIQDGDWMASGDLAVRDEEGYHYIVGRKKDTIKTGGATVYPAEIEAVLLAHPHVREAAVVGIPDEQWGELVVAAVVPAPGSRVDEAELIAFASSQLATYKRPRAIYFVDALPKSAAGKALKRELRAELAERHRQRMT